MPTRHLLACGALVAALLVTAFATQAQPGDITVKYRCTDKKPLTVTYHLGEARMTARMKVDAIERELVLDNHNTDKSLSLFSGEEHEMITDPINVNNLRRVTITSISNEVHEVRYENCRPVRRGRR